MMRRNPSWIGVTPTGAARSSKQDLQDFGDQITAELVYEDPEGPTYTTKLPKILGQQKNKAKKALFEDSRRTNRIHHLLKMINRCLMAFSLLCMSLSLATKEIEISALFKGRIRLTRGTPVTEAEKQIRLIVESVGLVTSALLVTINILRKMLTFKQKKMRLEVRETEKFLSKKMLWTLIYQSALFGVTPLPFFSDTKICVDSSMVGKQYCYRYNDFFHILQFAKISFFLKAITSLSHYASSSAYRVCSIFGTQNSDMFVIKCLMKDNPFRLISTLLLIGTTVFGYALRISESPLYAVDKSMDLTDFFNSCWLALISMTTVGYGDFYPRTILGRLIIFVCCLYGMVVTSLLVAFMAQELQLSTAEYKAYTLINRLNYRLELKTTARQVVGQFAKLYLDNMKKRKSTNQQRRTLKQLYQKCKDIYALQNKIKSTKDANQEEDVQTHFQVMGSELADIRHVLGLIKQGLDSHNNSSQPKYASSGKLY